MGAAKPGVFVLVAAILGSLAGAQNTQRREDARGWFLQVQERAFDAVMPLDVPDVVVASRASHESSPATPERYFAIQRIRVGGMTSWAALTATVVAPVGRSVQEQLIGLREQKPSEPLSGLLPTVTLKRDTIDLDKCKAAFNQVMRLSDVQLSIPRPEIIVLDAPIHEFNIHLGSLTLRAAIEGNRSSLVEWGERTHELLLGCLSKR